MHFFKPTRMERYIVSCYAAEDGAISAPHRDNTTKGTAHRRFAVSINLNDEFEGGEVGFPGIRPARATRRRPAGPWCSPARSSTRCPRSRRARRFAFLPFLYDEEAAKVREANNAQSRRGRGRLPGLRPDDGSTRSTALIHLSRLGAARRPGIAVDQSRGIVLRRSAWRGASASRSRARPRRRGNP